MVASAPLATISLPWMRKESLERSIVLKGCWRRGVGDHFGDLVIFDNVDLNNSDENAACQAAGVGGLLVTGSRWYRLSPGWKLSD
jgi:hypothetical protein